MTAKIELKTASGGKVILDPQDTAVDQTLVLPATAGTIQTSGATLTTSANLTFTGTGNRITGDFSNATIANRVMFQTSTVNEATRVSFIPNGTSPTSQIAVYSNSDPTNASVGIFGNNNSTVNIQSAITGTGTYLPIGFFTGGSERMRIDSSGNVGIGTSSPTKKLVVSDAGNIGYEISPNDSASNTLRTFAYNRATSAYVRHNQQALDFVWQTGASPSDRMVIDSSGNVGIGTSSPSKKLNVSDGTVVGMFHPVGANGLCYIGTQNNYGVAFNVNDTERMRIDSSGNLLVGATGSASGSSKFSVKVANSGNATETYNVSGTAAYNAALFYNNGGSSLVGYINVSGSSTAYVTSSDYRLKESITPMTGALAKNDLLNPVTYKWKVDGSDGQGFIAHELQAVFPDAVTGEKDEVDEDGNPKYQGVDTSFLVGHLVACVKELKSELDSVKAELAAMKGSE